MSTASHHVPAVAPPLFPRVVCGVDGSRGAGVALSQASLLADRDLELVAVAFVQGSGPSRQADLSPAHAAAALDAARHEVGRPVRTLAVEHRDTAAALTQAAAGADLLVVGAPPHHRAGGAFLGSAASTLLHRAPVSVLVARRPPVGATFPGPVVVGDDGSERAGGAVRLAADLAARHGTDVVLVHAGDPDGEARRAQAEHAVLVRSATGSEPVVITSDLPAHRAIVDAAAYVPAALVVVGARGVTGVRALGSVSERVAHEAPCSVLVVRPAAAS
jgi:nucleotide-binding universal stress UspA family protein